MNNHISYRRGRHAAIVLGVMTIIVAFAASACHLDRLGTELYTFGVAPENVCPGDLVTVNWSLRGGQQIDSCGGVVPRNLPYSQCRTVDVRQDGERIAGTVELSGERHVSVTETSAFCFQGYDALWPIPESPVCETVNVIEAPELGIPITYHATCRGGEIVYVATPPITQKVGQCVAIQEVRNISGEDIIVTSTRGGASYYLARGEPTTYLGTIPMDLSVEPALDPVFVGAHPCTPDAEVELGDRAPLPGDITILLIVTCSIPSGAEDCGPYDMMGESTEPSGADKDSDSPPLSCDLTSTCGDGVCDSPCEDVQFCAEDCTPAPPDTVAFCGSACSSDADCAGLGVNPMCASGQCYDAQACKPEDTGGTGSNDQGGNEGGGQQAVCGNGIVEAGEACDGGQNGSCDWDQQYCSSSCSCDTLD